MAWLLQGAASCHLALSHARWQVAPCVAARTPHLTTSTFTRAALQASTQAAAAGPLLASVMVAAAASLPKEAVADTTGAGDAFIGSVLYGLVTGLSRQQMLQLASLVAACKCTALGARPGLPRREQLRPDVLGPAPTAAGATTQQQAQPAAAAAAGVSA
jgi:bifunctional ADP-heptose synthase (sugar kinase/adenylyltransferase)